MPVLSPIQLDEAKAAANEEEHVHQIYEQIADHFSQTRYKPWPLIEQFLNSLVPGSIGLDSGTGNGKYLPLNRGGRVYMIGLDRSEGLLKHARYAGGFERDVVLGDALGLGWRVAAFDFAISIATIHHLSTPRRRCDAIKALLTCLNPNSGRLLLYVWATEQDALSKRVVPYHQQQQQPSSPSPSITSTSTPPAPPSSANLKSQDVLVPWVLTGTIASKKSSTEPTPGAGIPPLPPASGGTTYQRYYHLFTSSELPSLFAQAADELGLVVGSESELDGERGVGLGLGDVDVEVDVEYVNGVEVVREGWERSNYYLEARRWRRPG